MPSSPEVRRERYHAAKTGTPGTKPSTVSTRKPRGRRKPTANQIASNVGSILEMGNEMALAMVPAYRLDALQPYEIQLLSNAAAAEILANAALLKWYQSVGSQITGPHTLAAAAIVAVALPRLARRNMVPGRIAAMAQGLALGMSNIGADLGPDIAEGPAVQDDAGPARSDNGHDGFREIRVGPGAPGLALVPSDSPDETGQHIVPDR